MRRFLLCFVILLTACTPVVDSLLKSQVQESYNAAEHWFLGQIREDKGLFNYLYQPESDTYSSSNNAIRQLMAAKLLADISIERPQWRVQHERNLRFIMQYWYKEDGKVGYIFYDDKSKLGANALALRLIIASPLYEQYAEQAEMLYLGIISLMDEDGSLEPWFIEPDYEYDTDYLLTFYSGEALLALAEYAEKTRRSDVMQATIKSQDFYIDRYINNMDQYYYPAYVPWHTQSLSVLYDVTGDPKYIDAIFTLTDKVLELQATSGKFIGRFYNPATPQYGNPHSSSDGVYTEGIAYAYAKARSLGYAQRAQRYKTSLEIAVQNLISLQYDNASAAVFPHSKKAIGGLRTKHTKTGMRIDCTQHTMDAYRKLLEVL